MPRFTVKYRSRKSRFNKHQRAAYKRGRRRYKNRQQLLSIKTVKNIAKKAVENLPETKSSMMYSTVSGDPVIVHYNQTTDQTQVQILHLPGWMNVENPLVRSRETVWDMTNPTTRISRGTGRHQRVGNEVFFKGINLRFGAYSASHYLGTQTKLRIMVVQVPNALSPLHLDTQPPGVNSPPHLPVINNNSFAFWHYQSQQEVGLEKVKPPFRVLFSKWISVNPNRNMKTLLANNVTIRTSWESKVVFYKKFIKINKKIKFRKMINDQGAEITVAQNPIYLLVYGTTNLIPTISTTGFRWQNDENILKCKFTALSTWTDA